MLVNRSIARVLVLASYFTMKSEDPGVSGVLGGDSHIGFGVDADLDILY